MKSKRPNYEFITRWSADIEKCNYTMIPNLLIKHQKNLNISSAEFVILQGLILHKWTERHPYPSLVTISEYCGLHPNTVRRNVRNLESKEIIKRIDRNGYTNEYNFSPLINKLNHLAKASSYSNQEQTDPSSQLNSVPYSEMNTKEDPIEEDLKKTQEDGYAMFLEQGEKLWNKNISNRQKTEDK